jgi:hypothetical protein
LWLSRRPCCVQTHGVSRRGLVVLEIAPLAATDEHERQDPCRQRGPLEHRDRQPRSHPGHRHYGVSASGHQFFIIIIQIQQGLCVSGHSLLITKIGKKKTPPKKKKKKKKKPQRRAPADPEPRPVTQLPGGTPAPRDPVSLSVIVASAAPSTATAGPARSSVTTALFARSRAARSASPSSAKAPRAALTERMASPVALAATPRVAERVVSSAKGPVRARNGAWGCLVGWLGWHDGQKCANAGVGLVIWGCLLKQYARQFSFLWAQPGTGGRVNQMENGSYQGGDIERGCGWKGRV